MTEAAPIPTGPASRGDGHYNHRSFSYGGHAGKNYFGQQYNLSGNQSFGNGNIAYLSQGVQGITFHQDSPYHGQTRTSSVSSTQYPSFNNLQASFWAGNNPMMLAAHQPFPGAHGHASMFNPNHYLPHGYGQGNENSPMSQGWNSANASAEVPSLITPRRESISSTGNDTPATPVYPPYHAMTHGGVTILNRSPNGNYTASTPSPLQMLAQYGMPMVKLPEAETISPRLKLLVTKQPAIPRAIPAPSSPNKPLDRSLENPRGETNVYIRGLMPETSDDMLDNWGRRFGDVKSSKSIIDHSTGLCKGYVTSSSW